MLFYCGDKASESNLYRAKVRDLVNLDLSVEISVDLKYLSDLVCGQRIETATEGNEVNEIQVISGAFMSVAVPSS